eukprot:gene36830-40845_t
MFQHPRSGGWRIRVGDTVLDELHDIADMQPLRLLGERGSTTPPSLSSLLSVLSVLEVLHDTYSGALRLSVIETLQWETLRRRDDECPKLPSMLQQRAEYDGKLSMLEQWTTELCPPRRRRQRGDRVYYLRRCGQRRHREREQQRVHRRKTEEALRQQLRNLSGSGMGGYNEPSPKASTVSLANGTVSLTNGPAGAGAGDHASRAASRAAYIGVCVCDSGFDGAVCGRDICGGRCELPGGCTVRSAECCVTSSDCGAIHNSVDCGAIHHGADCGAIHHGADCGAIHHGAVRRATECVT